MRPTKFLPFVVVALVLAVLYVRRQPAPPARSSTRPIAPGGTVAPPATTIPPAPRPVVAREAPTLIVPRHSSVRGSVRKPDAPAPAGSAAPSKSARLHYVIDDGIAVVQGDVAVGIPTDPDAPATGIAELKAPRVWPTDTVPYFIQPTVDDPDRVRRALALFARTGLRFVEFAGEEDALVFEPTTGVCKSYLGRIGGKQPIWIAPDCGPPEIAHEVMHALGFAHEQNRADRDDHITLNVDGIEEQYRFNFEKLSAELTKASLVAPFDFTSIMIYPPWMFAKGGQTTMHPRNPDRRIAPGQTLSPADEDRIVRLRQAPR